jgi:large subunit ribosomal protein L18
MRAKRKQLTRDRRRKAIRKRLHGTQIRPRLSVFRSLKNIYAQIIDDETGRTLVSMSTKAKGFEVPSELPKEVSQEGAKFSRKLILSYFVGMKLGEKAIAAGIQKVAFDRGGYKYHGRVKALAEGARKSGLDF